MRHEATEGFRQGRNVTLWDEKTLGVKEKEPRVGLALHRGSFFLGFPVLVLLILCNPRQSCPFWASVSKKLKKKKVVSVVVSPGHTLTSCEELEERQQHQGCSPIQILKTHDSVVRASNRDLLKAPQEEPRLRRAHVERLRRPSSPSMV